MSSDRKPPLPPAVYARHFEQLREGQEILEELTVRFGRGAKLTGGIDAVLQTYHNAGAASVIAFIVNRINQAHGVPTDDDTDPE